MSCHDGVCSHLRSITTSQQRLHSGGGWTDGVCPGTGLSPESRCELEQTCRCHLWPINILLVNNLGREGDLEKTNWQDGCDSVSLSVQGGGTTFSFFLSSAFTLFINYHPVLIAPTGSQHSTWTCHAARCPPAPPLDTSSDLPQVETMRRGGHVLGKGACPL